MLHKCGLAVAQLGSDVLHEIIAREGPTLLQQHHSRRVTPEGLVSECVDDIVFHAIKLCE